MIKHQKRRIRKIRRKIDEQQSKERNELLQEHIKKWSIKDERLYTICERYGGHKYRYIHPKSTNLTGHLKVICDHYIYENLSNNNL